MVRLSFFVSILPLFSEKIKCILHQCDPAIFLHSTDSTLDSRGNCVSSFEHTRIHYKLPLFSSPWKPVYNTNCIDSFILPGPLVSVDNSWKPHQRVGPSTAGGDHIWLRYSVRGDRFEGVPFTARQHYLQTSPSGTDTFSAISEKQKLHRKVLLWYAVWPSNLLWA